MRQVTDYVDSAYLQQPTPRSLPFGVVRHLAGSYVLSRPQSVLDPWVVVSAVALAALWIVDVRGGALLIPVAVLVWRVLRGCVWLWRRVHDDVALLRHGEVVRAHVDNLRPHRGYTGQIEGALLDCTIPITARRVSVGSVWFADGQEALRLAQQRSLHVLCLTHAPGTWRIIEPISSAMRYDPLSTMTALPTDSG